MRLSVGTGGCVGRIASGPGEAGRSLRVRETWTGPDRSTSDEEQQNKGAAVTRWFLESIIRLKNTKTALHQLRLHNGPRDVTHSAII
ncbi:hypothetical protein EYF80_052953 [Liparis tanakae]|uniref:Uncharacterized protein n=1 Tax=Liparis tanakae TaxID=230148 RepID=A0A4Z2F6W1_9TELE|nr:hypothetical protein EYF80_052953 [Liparis tanakae]